LSVRVGLVALAAIAAIASMPASPNAAPQREQRVAGSSCSPGYATKIKSSAWIAGALLDEAPIKAGQWIRTDDHGEAEVCLQQESVTCRVFPNSRVQILPKKKRVLLALSADGGTVSCSAKGASRTKTIIAGGQTITLGDLDLTPSALYAAGASGTGGHLFTISASPTQTVVKVRRGATIVAKRGNRRTAVVVGRDQQTIAPKGKAPGAPTAIRLTSEERRVLQQLEKQLPKDTDRQAPFGEASGPSNPSSLRAPVFTFTANESDATFSCSLDKPNDFRLCTSGQRFPSLAPGRHYLGVKVTDRAGNTRAVQVYGWTIRDDRIVYASDRAGGGKTDIYVMDSAGDEQTRLTTTGADAAPEWSPDRKLIAFHSTRDGNSEIYVMSAAGTGVTRLTKDPLFDRNPTWSPDGTKIVFEHGPEQYNARDLYVMNADGTGVRRLTQSNADDFDPAWSPDGKRIAFASTRDGGIDVFVMNADGSQVVNLTKTPESQEFGPSWSPDGTGIAFHSNRARRSGQRISQDIFVMNADGSGVQRVTTNAFDDYNPSWAPDGNEIAFQTNRDRNPRMDIYYVSLRTHEEVRLTNFAGEHIVPNW
jgi:Tol biopolymer transport system component